MKLRFENGTKGRRVSCYCGMTHGMTHDMTHAMTHDMTHGMTHAMMCVFVLQY